MRLAFPDLKAEPVKSDYFLKLSNGSEIWHAGLDDSDRVEKILGKEYSTIYFNEISQIDYSSAQVAITRLAEKNDLVKKVYYDCNPPSKKHWCYWQFIKKLNPETSEPLENPDNYASLLMNPEDNKENIDEDYISSVLSELPEKQKARFLRGEFLDDDDGQVYYEFNREQHVRKLERESGSILVGMDFNVNPMTATIVQYINDQFCVIDEIFLENSDTFKMSAELRMRGYSGAIVYPDSTGANRKTSGISDHQILVNDGFRIESTRNPFVNDRVNNMNRLLKDNRILIDPKCKKLIGDLEKVSWKDGGIDQKSDPMLSHISDSLGYLTWRICPLMAERKSKSIQL